MEVGKFGIFLGANTQQFDSALRRSQKKMGGFGKSANKLGRTVVSMFGAFSAAYVIRDAFNTVKDFEQANADLASVLGVTRSGVSALTADAERLGATTAFTATEVAQLQKEFAKLGFSQNQILNTTEATLNLAAATGTELARAAEVAGATLNAFGLDASETGHVTDVMAKSFSTTALDMEAFAETMKLVGPIANAAGYSLEETTAAAGQLANAGIKGSLAGTALKNIFSELVKTGKPLGEALADIKVQLDASSTNADKLALAESIVGERSKAALIILTDQIGVLNELTHAFEVADGAAKAMAETQLNTVAGSLTKLSSAWDGFILNLNKSGGEDGLGGVFKKALDYTTDLLGAFSQLVRYGEIFGKDVEARLQKVSAITFDQYTKRFTKALEEGKMTQAEIIALAQQKVEEINEQLNAESNLDKYQRATLNAQLDGLGKVLTYYQEITGQALTAANAINTLPTPDPTHGTTSIAPLNSSPIGFDTFQLGDQTEGYDLMTAKTEEVITANSALVDSFKAMSADLGSNLASGASSWEDYSSSVKDSIFGVIKALIIESALKAAAPLGPFGLAAVGGLIGLGFSLIKGATAKPTPFAEGGIVSGPTLGLVGEYSGARTNPEVIAPLDKLKSLLPSSGPTDMNISGEFKMSGRDLKLVLNNENVRFTRL